MRFLGRVYLVFDQVKTATAWEVAEAAARLGTTFPDGYAEYVTELGAGTLSTYLRIWLPGQVAEELAEHRRRMGEYYFWDADSTLVLSQARARGTVLLGNTIDGDDLVFHPERPDELFVLPRHQERIYPVGPGLDEAIDWFCDSGVLTQPATFRYFEPDGDRERVGRSIALPYREVRDALVALGVHDHVAFDERAEDQEKVFTTVRVVDGVSEEVDLRDEGIKLLIREIGGDVFATREPFADQDSTSVDITYVAGSPPEKLDRSLALLDELDRRGRGRKRRRR